MGRNGRFIAKDAKLSGITIGAKQLVKSQRTAKIVCPVSLLFLLTGVSAGAQSSLPPSAQADVLKNQIVAAMKARDSQAALRYLEDYHRLEGQGIPVPLPLLYEEAIMAKTAGKLLRAYDALAAYLNQADKSERHYSEAVRLYAGLEATKAVHEGLAQRAQDDKAQRNLLAVANPSLDGNWVKDAQTQCAVWDPSPVPNTTINWAGPCVQGRASGDGVATWSRGGKITEVDTGHMESGQLEGHGTTTVNGTLYEGDYKHYQLVHGTVRYSNGWYEGDLKDGKREGRGSYHFSNDSVYDGDFRGDQKEGHGSFSFADGTVFYGEYRADWPIDGVLTHTDGSTCKVSVTKQANGSPHLDCAK
jgi:hypothetical protein